MALLALRKRRHSGGIGRRFARDCRGVMAVEFALIAPVMVMMLFGLIELTDAILAKRRLYMGASMVGDLTTNRAEDWVHKDDLDATFEIAKRVLEPYGLEETTVKLTAVTWDDDEGEPVVVWSRIREPNGVQQKNPDGDYQEGEVFKGLKAEGAQFLSGTEQIVQAGDHLIVAEIEYEFKSSLSNIVFGKFDFNVQEVRVPRRSRTLAFCESDDPDDEANTQPGSVEPNCTDGRDYLESERRAEDK